MSAAARSRSSWSIATSASSAGRSPRRSPSTPTARRDEIVAVVNDALLAAGARTDDVAAIGVGVPGRVDPATGTVTLAVNLGWSDLPLGPRLEARLGRPCVVENDVRAAALGLHRRRVLGDGRRPRLPRDRDRGLGRGHPRRPPPPRRARAGRRDRPRHRRPERRPLRVRAATAVSRPSSRARRSRGSRAKPSRPAGPTTLATGTSTPGAPTAVDVYRAAAERRSRWPPRSPTPSAAGWPGRSICWS